MWWGLWLLVDAFGQMIHARWLWKDGKKMEKACWRSSSTSFHLIGIFVTIMWLTTTTTSGIHCHQLRIHGWLIGGSVGYFLSFWTSQRIMHLLFYATLSSVGYVRRECLRYWSFVGSWCGNLLTVYTLVNRRLGVSSCNILLISLYLRIYKNRKWICTEKTVYQQYSCSFKCGKI